jgi:organic radical activating enzyme
MSNLQNTLSVDNHLINSESYKEDLILIPSYADVFDALCYVSEGSFDRFSSLIRILGGEPWIANNLLRNLSSLGHLDYEIDENLLRPKYWRIADPSLIQLNDQEYVYAGWRSKSYISKILQVSNKFDAQVIYKESNKQFPILKITKLKKTDTNKFCELLKKESNYSLSISENFSEKLLTLLPKLSELKNFLPKVMMPVSDLEFFDTKEMTWKKVDSSMEQGAYRHLLNGVKYFYQSSNDFVNSYSYVCDARLCKYFVLTKKYQHFFMYDELSRELRVLMGFDLPFLYERVAVMCSGELPELRDGVLVYKSISRKIAEGLAFKLFVE